MTPLLPVDQQSACIINVAYEAVAMTPIAQRDAREPELLSECRQPAEHTNPLPPAEEMRAEILAVMHDLTPRQLRGVWCVIHGIHKRHAVDFRASIKLPFVRRLYVNVAAGKERRNSERLAEDGLTAPGRLATLYGVLLSIVLGYGMFGFFCFAYLMKSVLKINIFSGPSPFHPLYALFIAG